MNHVAQHTLNDCEVWLTVCIPVSIKTRYLVLVGLTILMWDLAIFLVQHSEFHNVVFFLFGDSRASEFYVPTFRNILVHLHRSGEQEEMFLFARPMNTEQSVPKRRQIKFSRRCITQKQEYNVHNTAKIWNRIFHNALWDLGLVLVQHEEFRNARDLCTQKTRTFHYYA